jgi:hypothetical protein
VLWISSKSTQPALHYPNIKSITANTKHFTVRCYKPFHPTPTITNIRYNTHFIFAVPTPSNNVCEDFVRVIYYFENFRRHLILMFVIADLLLRIKSVEADAGYGLVAYYCESGNEPSGSI